MAAAMNCGREFFEITWFNFRGTDPEEGIGSAASLTAARDIAQAHCHQHSIKVVQVVRDDGDYGHWYLYEVVTVQHNGEREGQDKFSVKRAAERSAATWARIYRCDWETNYPGRKYRGEGHDRASARPLSDERHL